MVANNISMEYVSRLLGTLKLKGITKTFHAHFCWIQLNRY